MNLKIAKKEKNAGNEKMKTIQRVKKCKGCNYWKEDKEQKCRQNKGCQK